MKYSWSQDLDVGTAGEVREMLACLRVCLETLDKAVHSAIIHCPKPRIARTLSSDLSVNRKYDISHKSSFCGSHRCVRRAACVILAQRLQILASRRSLTKLRLRRPVPRMRARINTLWNACRKTLQADELYSRCYMMFFDVWSAQRTARMLVFSLRQGASPPCLQPVGLVALLGPLFGTFTSTSLPVPPVVLSSALSTPPPCLPTTQHLPLLTHFSRSPLYSRSSPQHATTQRALQRPQIYPSRNTTMGSAHSACRAQGDTYRVTGYRVGSPGFPHRGACTTSTTRC